MCFKINIIESKWSEKEKYCHKARIRTSKERAGMQEMNFDFPDKKFSSD